MKKIVSFKYLGIIVAVILLIFLISKSLSVRFIKYQKYRTKIIELQRQDADLELNILKSRYELFTTYDPLVKNFTQQKKIQQQLHKIPSFINVQDKQEMRAVLAERLTLLEQKESLSEWFKTQNALLKNSLRYLPLLISQLQEVSPSPDINQQQNSLNLPQNNLITKQDWFNPLKFTLNDILRDVLLYNATNDDNLVPTIKEKLAKIDQLYNTHSISEEEFPLRLVQSHVNLILAQKPQIETLTAQLSSPLTAQNKKLGIIYDQYYQKAVKVVNVYRVLTILILLSILTVINYLIIQRNYRTSPEIKNYKKIVRQIISEEMAIEENEFSFSNIEITANNQDDLSDLKKLLQVIKNAHNLQKKEQKLSENIKNKIALEESTNSANNNEESFSFLTAHLLLITKNRQKILEPKIWQSLEVVVIDTLEKCASQLIEFQGETDRLQIIFNYPPEIQLSKLVSEIKTVSSALIYQDYYKNQSNKYGQDKFWSDAYFIVSCGGLNSTISDQLAVSAYQ